MPKLSKEEIERFDSLSQKTGLGIVLIDGKSQHILYTTDPSILGYTTDELIGEPLSILLPESIKHRHGDLMRAFKKEALGGNARPMGEGRVFGALMKDGGVVKIKLDIAYTKSNHFLAFFQPEAEADDYIPIPELYGLKAQIEEILDLAKRSFQKKIMAMGGGLGVISAIITGLTTPVLSALKVSGSTFVQILQHRFNRGENVEIVSEITNDQRMQALIQVRDRIRQEDPDLIAVAYYTFDNELDRLVLHWESDTSDPDGREVWFHDHVEGKLEVNSTEARILANHDCVVKEKGAALVNSPGASELSVIICPTFAVVDKDGLPRVTVKALIVGAYRKPIESIEPHAGLLWSYGPALETSLD